MTNRLNWALLCCILGVFQESARAESSAQNRPATIEDLRKDPDYFKIGAVRIKSIGTYQNPRIELAPPAMGFQALTGTQGEPNTFLIPSATPSAPTPPYIPPSFDFGSFMGQLTGIATDVGGAAGGDPMAIADLLVKLWDIVEENKPVVHVESKTANALPNISQNNWTALTGWKPEHGVTFSLEIKNGYGMTVVGLDYKLNLLSNGSYKGKGKYIASAQVLPKKVTVLWAYNLNVEVEVVSIVNMGTEENPIAGITLSVTYTYGNVFWSETNSNRYLVEGTGKIRDLDSGRQYF